MQDMQYLLENASIYPIPYEVAKLAWLRFRQGAGFKTYRPMLTEESENLKFQKSGKMFSFPTYGLSLAPAQTSGKYNVCRFATSCADVCVAHSGNGKFSGVQKARIARTEFLAVNPSAFLSILEHEIDEAVATHEEIALRLNTFSDLKWEVIAPWLIGKPGIHLYDYTKWPPGARPDIDGYDLTRSITEKHGNEYIESLLKNNHRIAVVLDIKKHEKIPETYFGYKCVDGDEHDARFTEDKGVAVVLRPKGSARKGGFVRELVV